MVALAVSGVEVLQEQEPQVLCPYRVQFIFITRYYLGKFASE